MRIAAMHPESRRVLYLQQICHVGRKYRSAATSADVKFHFRQNPRWRRVATDISEIHFNGNNSHNWMAIANIYTKFGSEQKQTTRE